MRAASSPPRPGARPRGRGAAADRETGTGARAGDGKPEKTGKAGKTGRTGKSDETGASTLGKAAGKGPGKARRGGREAGLDLRPPRTLTVGPATIALVLVAFLLTGGWAAFATATLIFGDPLSARLVSQQSEMQYAYEQKLVVFRAQLDRFAQQARSDRDGIAGQVTDLTLRQAALEARQEMLLSLAEQIRPLGASRADAGGADGSARTDFAALDRAPMAVRLARLDTSITRMESDQTRTMDGFVDRSESVLDDLQSAFAEVGLDPTRFGGQAAQRESIVASLPGLAGEEGSIELQLGRVRHTLQALGRLRTAATAVPFGRPIPEGGARFSSNFGSRSDPFTGESRFHAGVDFAAPSGTPVYAAGAGVVASAGPAGGYGNLVIIDHGNDITTRYAHLSEILVRPGQPVAFGATVGQVGSTGRSTGPHLHYETRLRGDPKDPNRFMLAGARITVQR